MRRLASFSNFPRTFDVTHVQIHRPSSSAFEEHKRTTHQVFPTTTSNRHHEHMWSLSLHCKLISGVRWATSGPNSPASRSSCSFPGLDPPRASGLWSDFSARRWRKERKADEERLAQNMRKLRCRLEVIC